MSTDLKNSCFSRCVPTLQNSSVGAQDTQQKKHHFLHAMTRGGLAQVYSRRGGSKTHFVLSCLGIFFQPPKVGYAFQLPSLSSMALPTSGEFPPPPTLAKPQTEKEPSFAADFSYQEAPPFFAWIAEEGFPYVPLIYQKWGIPVSRFLVLKVNKAIEVWKVSLEMLQSGLFSWIFAQPTTVCHSTFLRKLQLNAERLKSRVILLSQKKLPHWPLRISIEVTEVADDISHRPHFFSTNPLLSKLSTSRSF